jgi:hypothetical protein
MHPNDPVKAGRFAGATGFLFMDGVSTLTSPFVTHLEISGQICYAHFNDGPDDEAH